MATGVDKLQNSPINIRKDENLTHLLDSCHRDRPKGRREIPSWVLSLALHQLTKAPFEPIKEMSLKHLIFQHSFLLGPRVRQEKVCLGCISETVRCRKLILPKDIVSHCLCETSWYDLDLTFNHVIVTLSLKM